MEDRTLKGDCPHVASAVVVLLALSLLLSLLPGGLHEPYGQAFADPLPDAAPALDNYPTMVDGSSDGIVPMTLAGIEWSELPTTVHSFYDNDKWGEGEWDPGIGRYGRGACYTPENSLRYNGFSTPDHAVFDGDTLRFLGYGYDRYMDRVFTEEYVGGMSSVSYTLRPIVMNFHTFAESGLLFNGRFDGPRYTGYALILKNGSASESVSGVAEASLMLVYCEDELMSTASFMPGRFGATRTLVASYIEGINNLSTQAYDIHIERYPSGGFRIYINGRLAQDVPEPKSAFSGFGFYTGYIQHSCEYLTVMEFEKVALEVRSDATPTYATVCFMDVNSVTDLASGDGGVEIAAAQRVPVGNIPDGLLDSPEYVDGQQCYGYGGDSFKVTPPAQIGAYRYVASSRELLDPIVYRSNPARNVIILYYDTSPDISKTASVGGLGANGSPTVPVPVSAGDIIDYTVELANPGVAIARPVVSGAFPENIDRLWPQGGGVIAQTESGSYYVWGTNYNGRLGTGDTMNVQMPTLHPTLNNLAALSPSDPTLAGAEIVDIWRGEGHNIMRLSNGDYYVWGENTGGRLGLGTTAHVMTPVRSSYLSDLASISPALTGYAITSIVTGATSTIMTVSDGTDELYYTWGHNHQGQLGTGNNADISSPVLHPYLNDLSSIPAAAGPAPAGVTVSGIWTGGVASANTAAQREGSYTAIKASNGDVYLWGANRWGVLGLGFTTTTSPFAVTVPTINPYISPSRPECILPAGAEIVELWCGNSFLFARDSYGSIYAWGNNRYGQLGTGDKLDAPLTPFLHPYFNDMGAWDADLAGVTVVDFYLDTGFSVADYGIALLSNGEYYVWGNNVVGSLGLGYLSDGPAEAGWSVPELTRHPYLNDLGLLVPSVGSGVAITDLYFPRHYQGSGGGTVIIRLSNGEFYGWGQNAQYRLGLGHATNLSIPYNLTQRPQAFTVTDLLPSGLSLVMSGSGPVYGITDQDGVAVPSASLNLRSVQAQSEDGRDRVTFEFATFPSGTTQFHFKAQVTDAQATFENTGRFTDLYRYRSDDTNATWHQSGRQVISESYQKWQGDFGDTLKGDTHRLFDPAVHGAYVPYATTRTAIVAPDGVTWRYYAYQRFDYGTDGTTPVYVDASPVIGYPPNGQPNGPGDPGDAEYPWCWADVVDDHRIVFYFVPDIGLTIEYRDVSDLPSLGGADLKAPFAGSVPGMQDYHLPEYHLDAFAVAPGAPGAPGTWSYAGWYSLDGAAPVEGRPPSPAFEASGMSADKRIVLFFTQSPTVAVQYREYGSDAARRQGSQMLLGVGGASKEGFALTGMPPYAFAPLAHPAVADTVANGASSISGHAYPTYRGWSIDGGATFTPGDPPAFDNLTGGEDVILYFSTQFTVTELYHANDHTESPLAAATELKAPVLTDVVGGESFTGFAPGVAPPPYFVADGYEWEYIGWVMDRPDPDFSGVDPSDYAAMLDGIEPPLIPEVNASGITVTYIYQAKGPYITFAVTERFREKDDIGHVLALDVRSDIHEGSPFAGEWPASIAPAGESATYTYWGYQVGDGEPVREPFPGIDAVAGELTVTYLYIDLDSLTATVTINGDKSISDPSDGAGGAGVGRLFTFNALQVAALGSYTPTGSLEGSGIVVGEGAFAIEVGGLKASGSPYYFMVTELDESGNGWTYDSHSFWVEVTVAVADNESLSVEVTQTSGGTAFENVYHRTPGSTDLVLTGTKRATGRALADGQFEFAVFEGEAVVAHATNAASGHIRFSPIVYTEAGAHTYTVRETSMPGGGWTTDGAAYTVIVVVVDNKDGTLTATAAYPAGGLAFVNAYSQPTGGADKLPPLGDASAVVLLLLLGSAAACLCGHLAGRRRGRPIGSHSRL